MTIIDFTYYTDTFLGTAITQEKVFSKYLIKATALLNYYTRNMITSEDQITNAIKIAMCEIIDLLNEQDTLKSNITSSGDVQSETVGSHSKTYVNNASLSSNLILDEEALNSKIYNLLVIALEHTGLLYRGVR